MGAYEGPNIVTASMSFYVDAANTKSYTEIANGWKDLTGNVQTPLSLTGAKFVPVNEGIVNFDGLPGSSASTTTLNQSTEMTWDVWFRRTSNVGTNPLENYNMIFGHNTLPYLSFGGSSTPDKFVFSWYTKLGAATATQNWLIPPSNYLNNTWYNVTCTLRVDTPATTSTARMYVNGELVASSTTAVGSTDQLWPNSTTLRIAQYNAAGTYPFNGSISNLRIYNRILTDSEIRQNYQALVTRYLQDIPWQDMIFFIDAGRSRSFTKIENGWTDLTQNQATLPISGAYYDSSGGGSIAFNGIAGSASTSVAFVQYAEMTFDVWFNRTTSVTLNSIWNIGNTLLQFEGTGQFRFTWVTRLGAAATTAGREVLSPLSTYVDGVWYNVTTTLVQNLVTGLSTAKMYVNGVLVATNTPTSPLLDQVWQSTAGIKLGCSGPDAFRPFNGKVSNFKIFRRVLSDAEVLKNYLAMKDRFGHP